MITHWSQIPSGSLLLKNTDFKDRGKPIKMRIINAATDLFQTIQQGRLIRGEDHMEYLQRTKDTKVLETHSSVYKKGVRTENFRHWCENEGWPHVTIISPPGIITTTELERRLQVIAQDRGLPYNIDRAMLSLRSKPFMYGDENGMFCSEAALKFAGFSQRNYTGRWPVQARKVAESAGFFLNFNGETRNLFYNL